MTGHLMGAAGAIEAIASIKAIRESIVPPTINLTHPDPECDLDYTPNKAARRVRVSVAMARVSTTGIAARVSPASPTW